MPAEVVSCDLLIVGSGIMGASIARLVRESLPTVSITMVDGGSAIGATPGQHLHDTPDPELWERYNERVATGIQAHYLGADIAMDMGGTVVGVEPGLYGLAAFGEDATDVPGAALAWNAGGMGVHWTAATPIPWGHEVPGFLGPGEWAEDVATACRILRVHPDPLGPTAERDVVMARLSEVFDGRCADGRGLQPMPMAVQPRADGILERTGPNRIFEPIGGTPDPAFDLRTGMQAMRLLREDGRLLGAVVRDLGDGSESMFYARTTIVCADALRTPQLLFASGIRPHALGRNLNEHAFLSGRVVVDSERLGLDLRDTKPAMPGEWSVAHYWLPHSDEKQPFCGQIGDSLYVDDDGSPLGYGVGISLYVPTEIQEENRVDFSDAEADAAGLPRMTVHLRHSDADLAMIEQARACLEEASLALGPFDLDTESTLLPTGSSLHFTGTVRMGAVDDGDSVCDRDGRVWGLENLYVAGCGVIPTAMTCNTTLTGVALAVRTARAVVAEVGAREPEHA